MGCVEREGARYGVDIICHVLYMHRMGDEMFVHVTRRHRDR